MKKDTLQQLKEGAREGFRQKFFIKEESVSLWIIELANKIINGDLFVKIGSTNDTFQNKEKVALQDLFNQLEDFIDSLIDKAYEEGKRENNDKIKEKIKNFDKNPKLGERKVCIECKKRILKILI